MTTLVLLGSGEFTPAMDAVDSFLLSTLDNTSVAILPTAAGKEDTPQSWIDDGREHFSRIGVKAYGIGVLDRKDADNPKHLAAIDTAGWIYFSGGDPGYLFSTIHDTKLWKLIQDKYESGTILAGSSAGAMVMGNVVLSNAQEVFFRGDKPYWQDAFNLIPFPIFPHYNRATTTSRIDFPELISSLPKKTNNSYIGIDEDTALIIQQEEATVMGKGSTFVIDSQQKNEYPAGTTFLLKKRIDTKHKTK